MIGYVLASVVALWVAKRHSETVAAGGTGSQATIVPLTRVRFATPLIEGGPVRAESFWADSGTQDFTLKNPDVVAVLSGQGSIGGGGGGAGGGGSGSGGGGGGGIGGGGGGAGGGQKK